MVETCSITIVTSMKHSSYKKKRHIEKRGKREKSTICPWYIRRIAEMLIVCLPCHFGYGKTPVPCARGTPLAVLNDMQILTVKINYLDPKLSMHEVWPSYSRDLRLPTYTPFIIYSTFATLTLITSRCL